LKQRLCPLCVLVVTAIFAPGTSPSQTNFWQPMNTGMPATSFRALGVDLVGRVFAATFTRVYRSANNGAMWDTTSLNESVAGFATNPGGDFLALARYAGVFRSTDGGNSWMQANAGLTNPYLLSIAVDSAGYVFVGAAIINCNPNCLPSMFRSTDNGYNWNATTTGISDSTGFDALAVNSSGHIFAGGSLFPDHAVLYRSTNRGNDWSRIFSGPDSVHSVLSLAINSAGDVFAGTHGGGVFRSTDEGATWTQANTGLGGNTMVWSLAVNARGDIFAGIANGTFGYGVMRSIDNGNTWELLNSGLTDTFVYSLAITPTDHIFAGTNSAGVFRSTESTTSAREVSDGLPERFALEQNYPNPFNPSTTISFALPSRSFVSLKVFDALGRTVGVLFSEELPAGMYSPQWDATDLATGMYFCRLQTGSYIETKKLVLLR
jgi:photosystem II stability/assembly factor-like uncharacterized protein